MGLNQRPDSRLRPTSVSNKGNESDAEHHTGGWWGHRLRCWLRRWGRQIFTPLPRPRTRRDERTTSGTPWVEPGGHLDDIQQVTIRTGSFCSEAERTAQSRDDDDRAVISNDLGGRGPTLEQDRWTGFGGRSPWVDRALIGKPLLEPTTISRTLTRGACERDLVLFDEETRLVTGLVAYGLGYLGKLEGIYERRGRGCPGDAPVESMPTSAARELTGVFRACRAGYTTGSWLNHSNITAILSHASRRTSMAPLRTTLTAWTSSSDVQYENADDKTEQNVHQLVRLGVVLLLRAEGHAQYVILFPVNVADFETAGTIQFGGANGLDFKFEPGCRRCALVWPPALYLGRRSGSMSSREHSRDRIEPGPVRRAPCAMPSTSTSTVSRFGFIRDGAKAPLKRRPASGRRRSPVLVSFYKA